MKYGKRSYIDQTFFIQIFLTIKINIVKIVKNKDVQILSKGETV